MPSALALAALAVVGGWLASYSWDDDGGLVARLAAGAATGLLLLGLVAFVVTNDAGLTAGTLTGAIVVALPLATLTRPTTRARIATDLRAVAATTSPGPLVYALAAAALLVVVFDRVILERDGTLATGYVNNLGDLPFHLQVVASFAWGENFPPEHPAYTGTGFSYPYLSDFLTALFVRAGAGLRDAFLLQNLVLGGALVVLLARFTRVITGDRLAGYLAPPIVLFSGGLGFLVLLDQARSTELGLVGLLGALPQDYTIVGEGPFRWGNAITTLLVTQRSLAFGLPIALIAFTLIWQAVHDEDRTRHTRRLLVAGLLTGALVLVHAHSFGVVLGTAFFVGLFFREWRDGRWRGWSVFVVVALALALPGVWWSTRDSIADAGTFFGFELGWDSRGANLAWFWLLNTGLFVPLAALAALWPGSDRVPRVAATPLLLFTLAFLPWFIVPNVVKLAPWVWDNIKVLFYWFVGFTPLVALLLARLLRAGPAPRAVAVTALVVLVLAGSLDVWRVATGQTSYEEFDADGIAIAQVIRTETAPRDLVLHAPTWNPPTFLTGRRSLLGYTGYIWAHGLPYAEREADIKRIYAGEPDAATLLDRYGVDYVLVSPLERSYMPVDEGFWEQFRVVDRRGEYTLYEVERS